MEGWKIIFLSKWVICRFHVNLPGCKYISCKHSQMKWNLETISVVGSQWIQLDTTFLTSENPEQWRNPPMQNEMFICYDKGKTGENTTTDDLRMRVFAYTASKNIYIAEKMLVNIPSKCFALNCEVSGISIRKPPETQVMAIEFSTKNPETIEWLITQNFHLHLGILHDSVVATQIFFFMFTPTWGRFLIWRAYFWDGLKPPPRWGLLFVFVFFQWDEVTLKVDQLTCWCRKTSSGKTSWGIGGSLSHFLPRFCNVLPSTKLTWHFSHLNMDGLEADISFLGPGLFAGAFAV